MEFKKKIIDILRERLNTLGLNDFDHNYALDCIEQFDHYYDERSKNTNPVQANRLCNQLYQKLRNVGLIS